MKFNLEAVHNVAPQRIFHPEEDRFTLQLPIDICEGVTFERMEGVIDQQSVDIWTPRWGSDFTDRIKEIRYALIDRYNPEIEVAADNTVVTGEQKNQKSRIRLLILRSLLRIIRPTRERAQSVHGACEQGLLRVEGFNHPTEILEVPENQKLFSVRDRDIQDLIALAPEFLRVMRDTYWEIRMAVQFHEAGHYQLYDYKARFILWMSAIEGLFTSVEEQGSKIAKTRIKHFLGENSSIYPAGELHDLVPDPRIQVTDILDDLYLMRNHIVHGDRMDDRFFATRRRAVVGDVPLIGVLAEAASFIVRHSLLKILREGLVEDFKTSAESRAYFARNRLSANDIR